MPGRAQRGTPAHRMADQDDRDRSELGAEFVQVLAEIGDRRGLVAIPALDAEPRSAYHHTAARKRAPDRGDHRDHPEHGGLHRGSRGGADHPAAVRDDDHSPE